MRKIILYFSFVLLPVLSLVSLDRPAHAAVAIWEDQGIWRIYGDSASGTCAAVVQYEDNVSFGITFFSNGSAGLIVIGVNVVEGRDYISYLQVSDGSSGQLISTAVTNSAVLFPMLAPSVIKSLASAKALAIQDLGVYSLKGSAKAIVAAKECQKTLTRGY